MPKNYRSRKRRASKRVNKKSKKGGSNNRYNRNTAVKAKLQAFLRDYEKFKNLNHEEKIGEIESICIRSTPKLKFYVESIINGDLEGMEGIKNIVIKIKDCLEKNYRSNQKDKTKLLEKINNYLESKN